MRLLAIQAGAVLNVRSVRGTIVELTFAVMSEAGEQIQAKDLH